MVRSLNFSNFKNVSYASKVMLITELLNQYRDLVKYMIKLSGCAKINKSIRNNEIEIIFLFMEIPGKINFLQLGRFGRKSEQCYRQTFEREDMDWMEFNYRDAKQFTGLTHCQARSSNKLDFAYNASFAAVNVAIALRRDLGASLSIGRLKSMMVNAYYLERILLRFGHDPNMALNDKLVKELFGIAADVA